MMHTTKPLTSYIPAFQEGILSFAEISYPVHHPSFRCQQQSSLIKTCPLPSSSHLAERISSPAASGTPAVKLRMTKLCLRSCLVKRWPVNRTMQILWRIAPTLLNRLLFSIIGQYSVQLETVSSALYLLSTKYITQLQNTSIEQILCRPSEKLPSIIYFNE